ncbi:MAG: plasmid pRiA4b ORF-3 family protein [Enterovibrio sp.]
MMDQQKIFRFKISLVDGEADINIWREIDVPEHYNFWELHVAIQDAMGWLDYHLHEFTPKKNGPTGGKPIGIPESPHDDRVLAGWEFPIKKYFTTLGNAIDYTYDFGDEWQHEIVLIGMFLVSSQQRYPQCVAGEKACPPEDCGGVLGYQNLLDVIADPNNPEYQGVVGWLKQGHAKKYWPFNPGIFNAVQVEFTDPYQRWCDAFDQPYEQ